jgi:hypothetical protein
VRTTACRQLTFPNPDNFPSRFSKRPRDNFVSRNVTREFRQPEFEPALGSVREFAAFVSMPETSIDKHSNLLPRKNKIGFAKQPNVSSPPGDMMLSKN